MKLEPSLGEVRTLARPGRLVPVYAELLADLETPVSAYLKLAAGEPYAFLLESVEGGERLGRFSFIGAQPRRVLTISAEDPLPPLESLVGRREVVRRPDLPRFVEGPIGYLAYDVVRFFELRVPRVCHLGVRHPDAETSPLTRARARFGPEADRPAVTRYVMYKRGRPVPAG